MDITRLISNGNPNPVKKQRHPPLPQILPHINTTPTSRHGQLTTQSPSPTQCGHIHHKLPRILSSPPQQSSHFPSSIHHQQTVPTPMDLQPPPQSQPPQPQTHTPPNRRIAHILSEQKRRENINSGFEELKNIVPSCRGCADSKAVILRKAVHYIQTLESEIQKLKQPNNSPTTPNASATTPPLASPAMSTKSIHNLHNANGNLSLPPISVTLQAPPPPSQMQIHGNTGDSSVFALSDYNQRAVDDKNVQQQQIVEQIVEQQKHQQYVSQWQSNRMHHNQNYSNHSNHEPPPSHRQTYHQQSHNHQKVFTRPIPRHHSQYYYHENIKSENMNWNSGDTGGNRYNYYCS